MEEQKDNQPSLESRLKYNLIELIPGGSLYHLLFKEKPKSDKSIMPYIVTSALDGVKLIAYVAALYYLLR